MNAGYCLARVMPRDAQWGRSTSAVWRISGLEGALILCEADGWYLQATRPRLLPDWLAAQLRPRGPAYYSYWSRGPFATRQELLKTLRAEQEQAERPATLDALGQVLT